MTRVEAAALVLSAGVVGWHLGYLVVSRALRLLRR